VNPSLYRKKDRIEKGLPSFENAFQVRADRFDKKRQDNNKQACPNGICVHVKFCESKCRRDWRKGRLGFTGDPPAKRLWLQKP
jgi:hypothetical protein